MLRFGTDGVRGVANAELTPELALALGRAAARVLGGDRCAIGRDTRLSGPLLESALAAGLAAEGVAVTLLGVVPTPEVAWWSATEGAPAAVVSASHNPFPDNGIKLFAAGGRKLADEVEENIEHELLALLAGDGRGAPRRPIPTGARVGRVAVSPGAPHAGYAASVAASLGGRRLDGLTAVVDCANGSASAVAPGVLRDLGVDVSVIHAAPDGANINDGCGSTHLGDLARAVTARGADLGIAFDGDADRVMLVDAAGAVVDGDHIIAICAIDRHERGALPGGAVVVTVMTNLGFRLAMDKRGIRVVETAVGDRYVLEALEAGGLALGGEQSGHVIFRDLATTGDGLLTAVQALDALVRSGRPLAALAADAMTRLPQVLRGVRLAERDPSLVDRLAPAIAAVEDRLGPHGRVLVRPSGTEPVIRVMAEAPTESEAEAAVADLVSALDALVPSRDPAS
ncbi:MAG TPA: phosphoglucosamine mutase [Acidimicrobiales bacterium]|nr:phosphoglucosamine mutase [Acidimicrobiales bacterium]